MRFGNLVAIPFFYVFAKEQNHRIQPRPEAATQTDIPGTPNMAYCQNPGN